MATRRGRCIQCGRPILVPPGAYAISMMMCSGCQAQLPNTNNNHYYVNNNNNNNNNARPLVNYYPPPPPAAAYGGGGGRREQFYNPHHQTLPLRPSLTPAAPYGGGGGTGKKRAVLFGINYGKTANKLEGSINDAHCMKYFLIDKLAFPTDSIRILTDDPGEKNPLRIPTKHNMRMAMRWLVQDCQPGDSLVFYYSGHGSRVIDHDMDELDGFDEAICPVDYVHEGKILDDEINATIVRPLPPAAKLHAIFDTCFSGTILDLPFMCRMNRKGYYGWEDHRNPRAGYKGTRGGLAVCISACDDDGNAADTSAFSGMESSGALTYSFIQAMQDEPKLTYGRLLNTMRSTIRQVKEGTFGQNPQHYSYDIRQQYAHEPQLSSSGKFDIYSKMVVM